MTVLLLYRKKTATDPELNETSLLAGFLNRTTGEHNNGWRFFPLASNYTRETYSPYNGTETKRNTQSYLWPVYSQDRSVRRLGWNDEISQTHGSEKIPILFRHSKTHWPKEEEESRSLGILNVPIMV